MGAGSFATVLWWTVWRTLTGHSASDQKEVSPSITLHDKVCIVTGANVGIGYETALDFAKRGARVIVTCRDDEKGNRTVERIKVASGNQTVEYMQLELGSLKSVRTFAEEFRKKGLPLHILINNAGVMAIPKLTYTEDGFETQMGVNHLGHFLLTNLLLDIIEESTPSTIVNVSSSANYGGKINWNDLHFKEGNYHPFQAYCNSKLANVLFTYELAKRLKGKGVTVNSVHPGAVDTELSRHNSFSMDGIKKRWFKTPYEGALTSIYAAISPEAADATGTFWVNCAPVKSAKLSYDENVQKRFWDLSGEMVGLKTDS